MSALDKKQQEADAAKASTTIKDNNATLFNSPHQVVLGNPQGKVQIVEFFDYNCGFCKRALTDMLDLIRDNPKLKVVLKEMPILGPGSVEAARVAIAVRMQDGGGAKSLDFHRRLLGGRGRADKDVALAAARDAGLDMTRIETDMASDEVQATLAESLQIARTLSINGTPGYVIGNSIISGAAGYNVLKARLAESTP
jgi:protein-disulfide isomerase